MTTFSTFVHWAQVLFDVGLWIVPVIAASPPQEQALEVLSRSNLEVELSAKQREVLQLAEDIQRLQVSLDSIREASTAQISQLRHELSTKEAALRVSPAACSSSFGVTLTKITCEISGITACGFGTHAIYNHM